MSDSTVVSSGHIDFKYLITFLFRPQQGFRSLSGMKKDAWRIPMLLLSISFLLAVLVTGFLRNRAASMGEITYPVDWQWWSADMQSNYLQAIQATQGPVFLYIIPSVIGLAGIWLGWGILGGLLHLASTLLGGRGSMSSALNITAWAFLPFVIRNILRVIYMLIAGHPIVSSAFSGFVSGTEIGALFAANLLKHIDLFLLWNVILTVIGFNILDNLPRVKATIGMSLIIGISLLAQAGLGTLGSSLGGLMVTRPIF